MSFRKFSSVQRFLFLLLLDILETWWTTVNMKNSKENSKSPLYLNAQLSSLLNTTKPQNYCISLSVLKAMHCGYQMLHIIHSLYNNCWLKGFVYVFFMWLYISGIFFFQRAMCHIILNHFDIEILICTLVTTY